MLGVDVSTPAGVISLQKDFHHVRGAREAIDTVRVAVRSKVIDTLTGSAVTAILAALGIYLFHR